MLITGCEVQFIKSYARSFECAMSSLIALNILLYPPAQVVGGIFGKIVGVVSFTTRIASESVSGNEFNLIIMVNMVLIR